MLWQVTQTCSVVTFWHRNITCQDHIGLNVTTRHRSLSAPGGLLAPSKRPTSWSPQVARQISSNSHFVSLKMHEIRNCSFLHHLYRWFHHTALELLYVYLCACFVICVEGDCHLRLLLVREESRKLNAEMMAGVHHLSTSSHWPANEPQKKHVTLHPAPETAYSKSYLTLAFLSDPMTDSMTDETDDCVIVLTLFYPPKSEAGIGPSGSLVISLGQPAIGSLSSGDAGIPSSQPRSTRTWPTKLRCCAGNCTQKKRKCWKQNKSIIWNDSWNMTQTQKNRRLKNYSDRFTSRQRRWNRVTGSPLPDGPWWWNTVKDRFHRWRRGSFPEKTEEFAGPIHWDAVGSSVNHMDLKIHEKW